MLAGTRRRGDNTAEDEALEAELRADPKGQAEHVMLVDLARNDLGRIGTPGTVEVQDLMSKLMAGETLSTEELMALQRGG